MAVFYFFPSLYLHKYANAIGQAIITQKSHDINTALVHQKSFWKFVGIIALVMLGITILGFAAAIIIPMMAK